jgi:hypothetical protein
MQLDQFAAETCKEICIVVPVLDAYENSTQLITSTSKIRQEKYILLVQLACSSPVLPDLNAQQYLLYRTPI